MARNKYPEQTVEQILSISTKLFVEHGYDKTTIQDILDDLKMSKGAIYHHFKSKEEILEAIINNRASYARELLNNLIMNTHAENAREKIREIITAILVDKANHSIDTILSAQINNPHFVIAGIQSCVLDDASIISKLFTEGVADGSLQTDYPLECAEIFMLLLNIWINPVLFNRDIQQTKQRLHVLRQCMSQLGVDLISEEMIAQIIDTYNNMNAFEK